MKIRINGLLVILIIVSLYIGKYMEIFTLLTILICHELGHIIFLLITKQKINRITFTIFGGVIDASINTARFQEVLIFSGGIIVNLIIMILCLIFDNPSLKTIKHYNYLLLIVNSLPIYPLDGFKILETIISIKGFESRAFKLLLIISLISLVFFYAYAFIVQSIGLIVIGIYLLYNNYLYNANRQTIILKKIINNLTKIC